MNELIKIDQNVPAKLSSPFQEKCPEKISEWMQAYFDHQDAASERSRKEKQRDFQLFLNFIFAEEKSDHHSKWTTRVSRAFLDYMRRTVKDDGSRRWSDRTINRVLAHLKTLAKWIHRLHPFPLGNPMEKMSALKLNGVLELERAMTEAERRKVLDAADFLPVIGGRSKDKRRNKTIPANERPQRKGYRPWRNRAIVYALVETGIRRAEVCSIDLADIDFNRRSLLIIQKGGEQRRCQISREGLQAIQDYVEKERDIDVGYWKKSPALFLPSDTVRRSNGRLDPAMINRIMKEVCQVAGVENRTPHSARHGMGVHLIKKSGNPRAVQRQLGHTNPSTSMQYMQVTGDDLQELLDDR